LLEICFLQNIEKELLELKKARVALEEKKNNFNLI